jgi:hypothetical protein
VRKTILPLSIAAAFSLSFAFAPSFKEAGTASLTTSAKGLFASSAVSSSTVASEVNNVEAAAGSLYNELGLEAMGLNFNALKYAYKGYEVLKRRGAVRSNILTVVDFSQNSRRKRMYIIDMDTRKVLKNTYVAHGKNTGLDEATRFSNTHESLQSSLGFYITKGTYFGKHGLSLKLDGQERGWNDNAESRAVVVHGADYIGEHRRGAAYMGRSFGCPAVPQAQSKEIINYIKDGSCMFIYHPSNSYLHGSSILNG